jgi:AcrR family transcriptional regulator
VPRLWSDTIDTHRREVRDAILATTAGLVAERGLRAATMSLIAERVGIGRATLYKYFPDVEAILVAWHDRHVAGHLARLAEVRDRAAGGGERVGAVLTTYADIVHGLAHQPYGSELPGLVHRDGHVAAARRQIHDLVRDVLAEAATAGDVRADVPADELATFCLHAVAAAGELSGPALRRLVTLVMAGLRPAAPPPR